CALDESSVQIVPNGAGRAAWGAVDCAITHLTPGLPGDGVPPTVPLNPVFSNPGSVAITLSWDASADNVVVAGYQLDVSADAGFTGFVNGYENRNLGNV